MTRLYDQSQGSKYNIYKQSILQTISWKDKYTAIIVVLINSKSIMICDTSSRWYIVNTIVIDYCIYALHAICNNRSVLDISG
jgi:hypothetical protein